MQNSGNVLVKEDVKISCLDPQWKKERGGKKMGEKFNIFRHFYIFWIICCMNLIVVVERIWRDTGNIRMVSLNSNIIFQSVADKNNISKFKKKLSNVFDVNLELNFRLTTVPFRPKSEKKMKLSYFLIVVPMLK